MKQGRHSATDRAAATRDDRRTRELIIARLRRGARTIDDLATELGLTDNAVRPHVAQLEREGVVSTAGVRRSGSAGKPASLYELTPHADRGATPAYQPVLSALLVELSARLDDAQLDSLFSDVGARLAAGAGDAHGDLASRVRTAATVLARLGGDAEVEPLGDGFFIRGFACPMATAVDSCSGVCGIARELVAGITRASVTEECEHGDRPRCRFAVQPIHHTRA
jgi:predicted ArsR family transcriptional regulator